MIEWLDAAPELTVEDVNRLASELSLADLCVVAGLSILGPVLIVDREVRESIASHVAASHVELGGLLLGRAFVARIGASDEVPVAVWVKHSVRSMEMESTGVSLRMEPEVWSAARQLSDQLGLLVVGWYHSHPNLGAFFSGTDRKTQSRFFTQWYSLGYVVDPFKHEEKWFVGGDAQDMELGRILFTAC